MTATVPTVFAPGVNIGQLVILADAGYWQGKPHWKVRCRKCERERVVLATDLRPASCATVVARKS